MARRRRPEKRTHPPDPRYNNITVSKFVNRLMLSGKKTTAERVFYSAMEIIQKQSNKINITKEINLYIANIINTFIKLEIKDKEKAPKSKK